MKTISKTALVALTLVAAAVGGQAQAHTEWRYSFKGGIPPYAVPHVHASEGKMIRIRASRPAQKVVRGYRTRAQSLFPMRKARQ